MKRWLMENFLPMWAKETLCVELRAAHRENRRLIRENREQAAYIKGLEHCRRCRGCCRKGCEK